MHFLNSLGAINQVPGSITVKDFRITAVVDNFSGKSHPAVATVRAIVENNIEYFGRPASGIALAGEPVYAGLNCFMVSVVDLLGLLRESFNSENLKVRARGLLHRVRADAIVILDDIGAEKPSDWVEEQLYGIIDLRYRMQRSTIFY